MCDPYHSRHDYMTLHTHINKILSICHRFTHEEQLSFAKTQCYIIGLIGVGLCFLQNLSHPHDRKRTQIHVNALGEKPFKNYD